MVKSIISLVDGKNVILETMKWTIEHKACLDVLNFQLDDLSRILSSKSSLKYLWIIKKQISQTS